ncbi:MAG: hypothetical protein C0506_02190 [Anaerolinea sp.]|nr:hypothetical protein [Anaerolinea sp.]
MRPGGFPTAVSIQSWRASQGVDESKITQVRGPVVEIYEDGSWLVEERAGSAGAVATGRYRKIVFDSSNPPRDGDRNVVPTEGLVPRDPSKSVIVIGVENDDGTIQATVLMFW